MKYVWANWISSERGHRPDLPEVCEFMCLAGSARKSPFGLFRIFNFELAEAVREQLSAAVASPALEVLLDSCSAFPPALAGAARDLDAQGPMTQSQFASELERRLLSRLEGQREDPYVLARSRIGEIGYRDEGEFVWVVGYKPNRVDREVTWVASDFQVYSDDIRTFELEPEWLAMRFGLSG